MRRGHRAKFRGCARAPVIAWLKDNEVALQAQGVAHVALFASRARGHVRAHSDTDSMIEMDPDAPVDVGNRVR